MLLAHKLKYIVQCLALDSKAKLRLAKHMNTFKGKIRVFHINICKELRRKITGKICAVSMVKAS